MNIVTPPYVRRNRSRRLVADRARVGPDRKSIEAHGYIHSVCLCSGQDKWNRFATTYLADIFLTSVTVSFVDGSTTVVLKLRPTSNMKMKSTTTSNTSKPPVG